MVWFIVAFVVAIALWRAKVRAFRQVVYAIAGLLVPILLVGGVTASWVQHARSIDGLLTVEARGVSPRCGPENPYMFSIVNNTQKRVARVSAQIEGRFVGRTTAIFQDSIYSDARIDPGTESYNCWPLRLPDRDLFAEGTIGNVEIHVTGVFFQYADDDSNGARLEQELVARPEDEGWRRGLPQRQRVPAVVSLISYASPCRERSHVRDEISTKRYREACLSLREAHIPGSEGDGCILAGSSGLADGDIRLATEMFERSCKFGNWWGCFCNAEIGRIVGKMAETCAFFVHMAGTFKTRCAGVETKRSVYPVGLDKETLKYCAARDYVRRVIEATCGGDHG